MSVFSEFKTLIECDTNRCVAGGTILAPSGSRVITGGSSLTHCLEKCIRPSLGGSVLIPWLRSQLSAADRAIPSTFVFVCNLSEWVRIPPSSTYRVVGDVIDLSLGISNAMSGGEFSSAVASLTALPSEAVRHAASIGKMQDPCGIPVSMSLISSHLPSTHMIVLRSLRNERTH
jgi:hypothetical protein